MRLRFAVFPLLALGVSVAAQAGPGPLRLKFVQGAKPMYRIAVDQTTYSGAGLKTKAELKTETPIRFQVVSASGKTNSIQVTKGPLVVRGKDVGRSKTSTEIVDSGGVAKDRSPANFFVCLPASGAKVGQTWKAPFFGGPPLPAGIQVTYAYKGATPDGRFAIVTLKASGNAAAKMEGSGKLYLRLSDGFLDHGNAEFTLSYVQPDHKDRTKMSVISRVVLKYTITAK